MIRFKRLEENAVLLNPARNFERETQIIDCREDPLTGIPSFIHAHSSMVSSLFKSDPAMIKKRGEETQPTCPFCPEQAELKFSKFSADFIASGRLTRGEATLFPNVFAQKGYAAVVALSRKHHLDLNEITEEKIYDALSLAGVYLQRAYESGARYGEIGCNYLHPGGSSIMHPHFQVIASKWPYGLAKIYEERGRQHLRKYSHNYWDELIRKEKRLKERYIGKLGTTEWLVPFAPSRHHEVNAVVRGKSNILQFDDADRANLASGLQKVLKAYRDLGLACFNIAIYSGTLGRKLDYFWAGMKIVSRTGVQPYTVSDIWFSPNLLLNNFVTHSPELWAKAVKPYFT